jgi:hypothetical protein
MIVGAGGQIMYKGGSPEVRGQNTIIVVNFGERVAGHHDVCCTGGRVSGLTTTWPLRGRPLIKNPHRFPKGTEIPQVVLQQFVALKVQTSPDGMHQARMKTNLGIIIISE